ncbi:hypothetical protein OTU49_007536 [Cherax quadricarinatus]|uniref:Brix domain-containing protein n=1 Tax=Cherax quadricarinatus TaxID=27406 RepID=A0AAW0WGS3_CHEQU
MSEFSLRRQARLRREYLYRKSMEGRHAAMQQRKDTIKASLKEGKEIPTALQKKALRLMAAGDWDDPGPQLAVELGGEAAGGSTNVDDEYRWAGVEDPKIVITTSRDPSSKLKQFAKEVKLLFPNSQRLNRGNYANKQLVEACCANQVTDFIILHETRHSTFSSICFQFLKMRAKELFLSLIGMTGSFSDSIFTRKLMVEKTLLFMR